jgi:uncharacterized protein (TIGR01244 family)
MQLRWLDETIAVSPQVPAEALPDIAAQGVVMLINNRPDGEDHGQPTSAEMEQAARAAGLAYRHIPVTHGGLSQTQVDAMSQALAEAGGPVLGYCRAGVRSIFLWALARSQAGDDRDEIMRKASQAGYDLSPIAPYLG